MLDVGIGDLIDFLSQDRLSDSIILYVESINEAREFMSSARAFARRKPDRKILDIKKRLGHVLRLGSKRSRKPSPSKLKQKTDRTKAVPGNMNPHHSPEKM